MKIAVGTCLAALGLYFFFAQTPSAIAPAEYTYSVVETYPHDPAAYTQGLVIADGRLFEGTGVRGESELREVELETGEVIRSRPLDSQHFGEGIAVWNDKIYQLTWQANTGFVYDMDSFEVTSKFTYGREGWGLTADGGRLYMSDGTSVLRILDPETFEVIDYRDVLDGGRPVPGLNELEFVNGEIYANVWKSDRIVRIKPETGRVLGWIDLTGILDEPREEDEVLNGIAYDADTDRLFVTGKRWPKLFEITLVPVED